MSEGAKITVTKLDAAKRQLKTALRLWFNDGDPVSIHTLLAASHEIIHRLYRNKGLRGLLFDSEMVKDEYRKKWSDAIKVAPNFFKHADRDFEATLEFNPGVNEMLPLFLVSALRRMGEPETIEEVAYTRWMLIRHPELFHDGVGNLPVGVVQALSTTSKTEFLQAIDLLASRGEFPNIPKN